MSFILQGYRYWSGVGVEMKCETALTHYKKVAAYGIHLVNTYLVDPVSYFSFQPVLHDWCNKGRGVCYPVSVMVHIKEPLLLIEKSSLCGGSRFPFSLSEWSLTICLTPYDSE